MGAETSLSMKSSPFRFKPAYSHPTGILCEHLPQNGPPDRVVEGGIRRVVDLT